ncbi:hypothetical protein J2S59_001338 [Nocardioides massiliensis]|uniref:Bacterial spore germination immunoglobulin-like domain-containing protein n=1 Tax=Nocardioides massiliensis TaxID=1325935 RepID=A0ABT9NM79_9ACTN|nr:hypothetical protein [Nocardioides massiliensis]MDP9821529.1 hypothetical protein [Nocardioides massiliensis]
MAQQEHPDEQEWWRPVASGLGALVAVSLAIGLVVGLVALGATRILGGGDDVAATTADAPRRELPEVEISGEDRPDLHLRPSPRTPDGEDETEGADDEATDDVDEAEDEEDADAEPEIILSASPTQVSAMGRIDLTGVYPGAEGVTVEVQRRVDGRWESFSGVTANVSGGTFSTWVQTGRTGPNRFRVYDASADLASKPVTVVVG